MNSILTVTSAASNRALVILDQVKVELGITDTASDELLEIYRQRVSQSIASECGRQFARDTISQTFTSADGECTLDAECLILGRAFPEPEGVANYCTITSVTEDDTLLDPSEYELDVSAGLLYRLGGGYRESWEAGKVTVVFTAGYVLPDDGNSTLPLELSGVAVELIKMAKFAQARDPAIRSEDILSGLYSYTLFDPSRPDTAWPITVTDILDKYRNRSIA
jgi:Phage gp6-like head-tail connector protein